MRGKRGLVMGVANNRSLAFGIAAAVRAAGAELALTYQGDALKKRVEPLAQELLAMRSAFLSKLVYQTYNGYVLSQFKKLAQDLRNRGEVRWKHAMHLVRLLLQGIAVMKEGHLPVRVARERERLLAVRRGEVAWEEVNRWRLSLHSEFEAAYAETALPERPDYAKVNDFLVRARRASAEGTVNT
jgi:hypothetical protein